MDPAPTQAHRRRRTADRPSGRGFDPAVAPHLIEFQVTRWCDLNCSYCPAVGGRCVQQEQELSTAAAERLFGQISEFEPRPHLLLSGGDVLCRHDVFHLVRHAHVLGLNIGAKLCPTTRLTPTALEKLQNVGLDYAVMSVEGPTDVMHDGIRGGGGSVSGDFARTMRALHWAKRSRLPVQAQTLLLARNAGALHAIAERLVERGVQTWQIRFPGAPGRGLRHHPVPAIRYPRLFETIHELDRQQEMRIEIVGANHHVAYALDRGWSLGPASANGSAIPRRPIGLHAGKGLMYIDPDGAIHPARDLQTACGQVATDWLVEVYQRHHVFRALRDPNRFRGKCGLCEYRRVCGGNRARAMATGGSMLSDEPDCDHLPGLGEEVRSVG